MNGVRHGPHALNPSPIPVGAGHRLNRDIPDDPRGHAITGEGRGVEKALYGPSRRSGCLHVHRGARFCRSARHTRLGSPSAIEIELQRPNGARLRVAAPESQLPLLAVGRAFLETP